MLRVGKCFLQEQLDEPEAHDVLALVTNIDAPVLLIHGEDDSTVSVDSAEAILPQLQNGKLVQIEGGDHVFNTSNPFPLDLKAYDETIEHLQEAVENSKLGFADKSKTLKKLFKVAQSIERTQAPEADLDALVEAEWERAEKEGGHTWMGRVTPILTRAIFSLQNAALYGKREIQKRK